MIHRRIRPLAAALALLLAPATTAAQTPVPEEARAAMAPLGWLAGRWSGEATHPGPGGAQTLRQTEEVKEALDGSLLVIEGTGRELGQGEPGAVVFRAFAVVSAGDAPRSYRVAAWRAGQFVDAAAQIGPDGTFTWGFPTPDGGEVRYAIRQPEPGLWHETGSYRAPGGDAWRPFLDMSLRRDADPASR
ncbi:hypothetical protein BH20GEM1_BH20GEM1_14650 [soil metagenome]